MTAAKQPTSSLLYDLFFPTLLFMALGGLTWAVRGCSGYGAMMGCIYAGVTWGTAWWYLARDPAPNQSRRYTSAWIILAVALGIGLSGARGWMQWPSFFRGELLVNANTNSTVAIDRSYGFAWLFIAGVPWAGLGACLMAWCASGLRPTLKDWIIRLACVFGMAALASTLFNHFPELFLPHYKAMQAQYLDAIAHQKASSYPNLYRLYGDNRLAILNLGFYLGFLFAELIRRDWKNVTLITTVGLLNGIGWSLLQNWNWATSFWPDGHFNFWRCWESSGGISIGFAYGIAYYLVNRKTVSADNTAPYRAHAPNFERFALAFGLIIGLGLSIKCGLKGWANIYLGNEEYWSNILFYIMTPVMIALLLFALYRIAKYPVSRDYATDLFPCAYGVIWAVLIIQNILGQLVTGPHTNWSEIQFKLYYILLFVITGLIIFHDHFRKQVLFKGV